MATKLCQLIAVEKGIKNTSERSLTETYHKIQKGSLLSGISRTYRPKDDEGDQLPSESTRVQLTVEDLVKSVSESLKELLDVTASKDYTNCVAKADIMIGEKLIANQVPVTYLLWLEKKLVDIRTFVSKLPTLDPSENWKFDQNSNCFASDPAETVRTKKVKRNHVKAAATDKFAAQVETYDEDVLVGYWKTIKFSGAIPAKQQKEMLDRVENLQKAVKFAREAANSVEAQSVRVGETILDYVFSGK